MEKEVLTEINVGSSPKAAVGDVADVWEDAEGDSLGEMKSTSTSEKDEGLGESEQDLISEKAQMDTELDKGERGLVLEKVEEVCDKGKGEKDLILKKVETDSDSKIGKNDLVSEKIEENLDTDIGESNLESEKVEGGLNLSKDEKDLYLCKGQDDHLKGEKLNELKGEKPDDLKSEKPNDLKGEKPYDLKGEKPDDFKGEKPDDLKGEKPDDDKGEKLDDLKGEEKIDTVRRLETEGLRETNHESDTQIPEEGLGEEKVEDPVFDGTEVPGMAANRSTSTRVVDAETETQGSVWPEKAAAITNLMKEKGVVAVSTVLRRLSGKRDDDGQGVTDDESRNSNEGSSAKDTTGAAKDPDAKDATQKTADRSTWNPLSFIRASRDGDAENKTEQREEGAEAELKPIAMKGRVILYTRLGCQECKAARLLLHWKRLSYVEINIDVFPSRKLELEKISGSSSVPKVFFNEILIGGNTELKDLNESGKLDEKIKYLVSEVPPEEAPFPPLSGEDDLSDSGAVDELAIAARKMRGSIAIKDRFYKMRRFSKSFLGSEAVDFLSEDQYLEREEAIEFGRKLAYKLFFSHVLDENIFEDGNHLYRFLDDDPIVSSQCHNIPRGILDVKPKPIVEVASRLRFLSYAILEAYTSGNGVHIDYRSIHGSEEFARYLRTVEELQRVELQEISREEKLAFFINLYNMMAIHAILVQGYPAGALERRKLLGDFKYVVGGCTYSLSAIQNGILRANQRPPYNLIKPFGVKDKRSKVALPYPEPLVHFALVCGNRSGPALRCYSPGDIDKELVEAARIFLRSGGLVVDVNAKTASVSKILRWYSVDFGKNETEVLKHAANYLETAESEALLELLASAQLKVTYQSYDWSLNC